MGFGGSVSAMISSLKNNERNRKKRNHFDKNEVGGYGDGEKTTFDFPEATSEVLQHIREKLQKERRRMFWKQCIVCVAIATLLIVIFMY